jgi:hypothetical protein
MMKSQIKGKIVSWRGKGLILTVLSGTVFVLLITRSCIFTYYPEIHEDERVLVVEGLITDQPGINTIKISNSMPLWQRKLSIPLTGCTVWITDDQNHVYNLKETIDTTYVTDPVNFKGETGRKYTLHITTPAFPVSYNYESRPMEMKPVPPIESVYYEKFIASRWPQPVEGCNIFADIYNPQNNCKFFRWDYVETWEFHLIYDVPNRVCWATNNSEGIFIKNTTLFPEERIKRHPVISITTPFDRLNLKYSLLINQYSLSEDEYLYWERLKNTIDQTGSLYDLVPATIPNNLFCLEDPNKPVLGYFSVSGKSSRRIFIKDKFEGLNTMYFNCISDTIYGTGPIQGLDSTVWVIINHMDMVPPSRIITYNRECADCRARGTTLKPTFWDDDKK